MVPPSCPIHSSVRAGAHMRSLFFKIFAWFWLANIFLVGILVIFIGPLREPKPDQFRTMIGDTLESYGRRALGVRHREGSAAYAVYLKQLEEQTGFQLFVLNSSGAEIDGRSLPQGGIEIARQAERSGQTAMGPGPTRRMLFARPVSNSNAEFGVFVGQLPGPPDRFFASAYRTSLQVLAAVGMAGLLCYGLARYLTGPLRSLRSSARALAGGNLHARVGARVQNRRDEIGDLGQDFNFMAERIESLVLSQQKLILDISHELRSPLTRLNLALGLAVQRSGPEAQTALERINREAERLNDLIGRILVLARLEHRETAGESIAVDLAAMIGDITADAQFEARAQHRDAKLLDCDACRVTGIPHLLRSAIDNVIRNSLRYTAENTTVEIALSVNGEEGQQQAVVRVRDHGPGVPDESLEKIFLPFCRVGEDRNRRTGGVGLGLAIARQAVGLHGGTIRASNASGGGLVVEISLPCRVASSDEHGGTQ